MENWNVAVCKRNDDADFYLLNRTRTPIKFTTRIPFNMGEFLAALEDVKFPLRYTEGLESIRFRRLPKYYGMYGGDAIDISAKKHRPMWMYVETFIHEVAHHVDSDGDYSNDLGEERRKKGRYIGHIEARKDNSEYFARGFERFYSPDKDDRRKLRKRNPRLYKMILRLHKKHSAK